MCGFAGYYGAGDFNREEVIDQMGERIAHRGPDSKGSFVDDYVALGFRRLSIIDLEGGSQPIHSADGKHVIIFNGEIYNYQEIRKEIEVLVHGIKSPGYEPNMKKKRLSELYINAAKDKYVDREREWPDINVFREFERQIILRCIDIKWMQHINDLEILRQNIALVGYGQKDPAIVYKLKAFDMFNKMSDEIKTDSVYTLFSSRLKSSAANNGAA